MTALFSASPTQASANFTMSTETLSFRTTAQVRAFWISSWQSLFPAITKTLQMISSSCQMHLHIKCLCSWVPYQRRLHWVNFLTFCVPSKSALKARSVLKILLSSSEEAYVPQVTSFHGLFQNSSRMTSLLNSTESVSWELQPTQAPKDEVMARELLTY